MVALVLTVLYVSLSDPGDVGVRLTHFQLKGVFGSGDGMHIA